MGLGKRALATAQNSLIAIQLLAHSVFLLAAARIVLTFRAICGLLESPKVFRGGGLC